MLGDVTGDGGERADTEHVVVRDGHMVLAVLLRREPQVAAGFARDGVVIAAEESGELTPGEIAGSRTGRPIRR